ARRYYRKCLELGAENDKVLFDYANFTRDQGQLKAAIRIYRKALQANPRHALAVFNMGVVYIRLGETDRGFDYIQKAIQLNPDNEVFHENFGRLALAGGPLENAASALENFVERFPHARRATNILAELCFKLNKFERALHLAHHVIENEPADLNA